MVEFVPSGSLTITWDMIAVLGVILALLIVIERLTRPVLPDD